MADKKGFIKAMLDFFGVAPGQSIMSFGGEVTKLPYKDKLEFFEGLKANGVDCQEPIDTSKPK